MAKKVATKVTDAKNMRQVKLIERLKKKEHWMKWAIIAALIIILLLLLFIGYVTDWTAGLRKDSNLSSLATNLDSAKTGTGSGSGTNGNGSGGTSNRSSNSGSTTNGTTDRSSENSSRTSTSRSTTTNNSSTTTNNSSTTTNNNTRSSGLVDLYADLDAGDSIDSVISRANSLGIDVDCENGLLVRNCTFSVGGASISTKSLLSTGLVTSVLKNF